MKRSLCYAVLFLLCIVFSSCIKPKHSIRISNQYNRALNVNVGTDHFGLVTPGTTTSYQNIPEGSSQLSGDLTGSVSVGGKGTHKWTLTITSGGSFTILEDK